MNSLNNFPGNHIKGEVYEVDEKMMAHLDVLEDYPAFYDREVNEIVMEPGSNVEKMNCWIYMMRNFPEKMLCFPTLTEYRNSEDKPYRERCQRLPEIIAKDDLEFE